MRVLFFLIVAVLASSACASRQENEALRQQAIVLENEQQEMALRLAAFEQHVEELYNQLEPTPSSQKSSTAATAPATGNTEQKKAVEQHKPEAVSPAAAALASFPPRYAQSYTPQAAQKKAPPVAKPSTSVTTANNVSESIAAVPANDEQAAYRKALISYSKHDYGNALQAFEAFIAAYPNSKLRPNALYWQGECLYAQKKYVDSIFSFKQVNAAYPKHSKAPDALLKTAMAYKELGDYDNQTLHARILREDFPHAPATAKIAPLGLEQ